MRLELANHENHYSKGMSLDTQRDHSHNLDLAVYKESLFFLGKEAARYPHAYTSSKDDTVH